MTLWLFTANFIIFSPDLFNSSLWSFRFLVQEIFCGFLSFYPSFYILCFYDLSENHPGERVSWLKIIIIII